MIWDLVLRLGGQMRVSTGLGGGRITGWDMPAALALGRALDVPERLVAEILPDIEAVMVREINKGSSDE